MAGRWILTNPDAALRLDTGAVERYLREIVELIDATKPELGGTHLADLAAHNQHDRTLADLAHQVYGAVTVDRYTYVEASGEGDDA
jgi:hypothetical protein